MIGAIPTPQDAAPAPKEAVPTPKEAEPQIGQEDFLKNLRKKAKTVDCNLQFGYCKTEFCGLVCPSDLLITFIAKQPIVLSTQQVVSN
jgi:hypothetical protein